MDFATWNTAEKIKADEGEVIKISGILKRTGEKVEDIKILKSEISPDKAFSLNELLEGLSEVYDLRVYVSPGESKK